MPSITPLDYLKFSDNAYPDSEVDIPEGWEVLDEYKNVETGYAGKAFINRSENPPTIVIANRGTDMDSIKKDWINTNIVGIGRDGIPDQVNDVITFTGDIMRHYPNAIVKQTGHSLGGFLAEAASFYLGQAATSFDSPGNGKFLKLMEKSLGKESYENHKSKMQVSTYLSEYNLVNGSSAVLGRNSDTVIRFSADPSSVNLKKINNFIGALNPGTAIPTGVKFGLDTKKSHSISNFYQFFDSKTGKPLPKYIFSINSKPVLTPTQPDESLKTAASAATSAASNLNDLLRNYSCK